MVLSAIQNSSKDFFISTVAGQCVVHTGYFLALSSPCTVLDMFTDLRL